MAADAPRQRPGAIRSLALVLVPALAWCVGLVLGDRFLWSQFLAWVPALLLAVGYLALSVLLLASAGRGANRGGRGAAALLSLLLGGALVAWALLVEHRPFAAGAPVPPSGPRLAIFHCNLHWPGREAAPRVLTHLTALPQDLVVLSEPGWLLLNNRGAELQRDGWNVLRVGRYAVLSRLPIVEARGLVQGRGVDVTLLRLDASPRGMGVLDVGLVDLPSRLWRPRMSSAREVRSLLDELGAPPLDMAIGDFNTTRGSPSLEALFPGLHSAWDDAGRGWSGSFPTVLPLWHIDHLLLAPHLRAVDYALVDTGLTDHRAQVAVVVPAERTSATTLGRR